MVRAYEESVIVEEDGVLELDQLPVKVGDRVRVIVLLPEEQQLGKQDPYPLRGVQPYRFDDPTAPVAPEDWEPAE